MARTRRKSDRKRRSKGRTSSQAAAVVAKQLHATKENRVDRQRSNSFDLDGVPANADQFDGKDDAETALDIVIGFDFGTSCTKIILHDPVRQTAFAVPFGGLAHDSLEYILSTRLFVAVDGVCSLEPVEGASARTDLKVNLMEKPAGLGAMVPSEAVAAAAAYLALALRHTRRWFIATKEAVFGRIPLNWQLNIGLPAAIADDETLQEAFWTAGRAAWAVSKCEGAVTTAAAEREVERIRSAAGGNGELDGVVDLRPEVVAEIYGYIQSVGRQQRLHILVDVGASTLDICSFNSLAKGADNYTPVFTADVQRLGARELHLARITGGRKVVDDWIEESIPGGSMIGTIPDNIDAYTAHGVDILAGVQVAEESFGARCRNMLGLTYECLRPKFPPPDETLSKQLPVFICGGGRNMRLYRAVVENFGEWHRKSVSPLGGVTLFPLPKPEALTDEIEEDTYHRLAVAWGLSQRDFDIGTYKLPSAIPEPPAPNKRDYEEKYIPNP